MTMRSVARIAAAAAVLFSSSVVVAQDQGALARQAQDILNVDIKDSDYFEMMFRDDPRSAAETYSGTLRSAACASTRDSNRASSVLAADAGSAQEARAIGELVRRHGRCVVGRQSVPAAVVRGALAEVLWEKAGANPNPSNRSELDFSEIEAFFQSRPRGEMVTRSARLPLSWVSRCQVMTLPRQSAKVLATEPGSSAERLEIQTLYAKSGGCGVSTGVGDMPLILGRAALADALYQNQARSALALKR